MIRCLDIHTHHQAPQPFGVISCPIENFSPVDGQYYSIGVHPWETTTMPDREFWKKFEQVASLPCVVAIGECGIDKLRGAPLFLQMLILKQQIEISERLGKPMVLHAVKSQEQIIGMRQDGEQKQNWAIHGFRAKPSIAKMYTDAGIYLSFGETFNDASLNAVPRNMILAETDESPLSIEEVITNISSHLDGENSEQGLKNTFELIKSNTLDFFGSSKSIPEGF